MSTAVTSDSEPRKRARTDHHEDECMDAREDEEFWLDDGTIVLLAGSVKFRVYRGVLTEHSPVFVEMLSLPQPAELQDAPYSCPVICLHDNPENLRHVFRLLMPRKTANFVTDSAPTFDMVSAYIRIAHKYQMDALLNQWLEYLKKHFTRCFDNWIAHERAVPERFEPIHAIGVVNLARLTGCNSILPTALAVCTTLGDQIVTGFTRDDGTREQLSMADLGRCFQAKTLLIQANATAVAIALAPEYCPDNCTTNVECKDSVRSFNENEKSLRRAHFVAPEGLVPAWGEYNRRLADHYELCRHCLEMIRDVYVGLQRTTWSKLPTMTGVEVDGWAV